MASCEVTSGKYLLGQEGKIAAGLRVAEIFFGCGSGKIFTGKAELE
jgi:hypothetical protein